MLLKCVYDFELLRAWDLNIKSIISFHLRNAIFSGQKSMYGKLEVVVHF